MPRADPPLFAGLPYRRLSPAQRAALAARLAGYPAAAAAAGVPLGGVRARPLTVGVTFAGGGGESVGARQAGLVTRWAIERDPAIAAVYRANLGEHVICADALDLDPATLEPVDIAWFSPPCQNASVARSKRLPAHVDADAGVVVVAYARALRPKAVIIENVPPYRNSRSFRAIIRGLSDLGYFIDAQVVNSADFGLEIPCPLHAMPCQIAPVGSAARRSAVETARAYAGAPAMTPHGEEPMRDAWTVAEHLARVIAPVFAGHARCDERLRSLLQLAQRETTTPDGKAGESWTNAATSVFGSMGDTAGSIGLWLRGHWDALYSQGRLFTTSTETPQITILRILRSIRTTASTRLCTGQPSVKHGCCLCIEWSVPQTRCRLIVRALLGSLVPPLPAPEPWVGWYAAVEDLLPTLPASKFAPWQLRRLPWLAEATIVHPTADNERFPLRAGTEPVFTVTGTHGAPRAYLVEGGNPTGHTLGVCPDRPAPTVQASASKQLARAYLVHNQISQSQDAPMVREDGEPAPIVTTNSGGRVRAFLQMTSNTQMAHPTGTGVLAPESPSNTVTHASAAARAWLDAGRVVSMTPRALARFQSFPDWYELPASKGLACKAIGNAVPPLLAQRLFEGLAAVLREREEASA